MKNEAFDYFFLTDRFDFIVENQKIEQFLTINYKTIISKKENL